MAKSNRAYKSAKRSRELLRQQKLEEKRRRRFDKGVPPKDAGGESPPGEDKT